MLNTTPKKNPSNKAYTIGKASVEIIAVATKSLLTAAALYELISTKKESPAETYTVLSFTAATLLSGLIANGAFLAKTTFGKQISKLWYAPATEESTSTSAKLVATTLNLPYSIGQGALYFNSTSQGTNSKALSAIIFLIILFQTLWEYSLKTIQLDPNQKPKTQHEINDPKSVRAKLFTKKTLDYSAAAAKAASTFIKTKSMIEKPADINSSLNSTLIVFLVIIIPISFLVELGVNRGSSKTDKKTNERKITSAALTTPACLEKILIYYQASQQINNKYSTPLAIKMLSIVLLTVFFFCDLMKRIESTDKIINDLFKKAKDICSSEHATYQEENDPLLYKEIAPLLNDKQENVAPFLHSCQ